MKIKWQKSEQSSPYKRWVPKKLLHVSNNLGSSEQGSEIQSAAKSEEGIQLLFNFGIGQLGSKPISVQLKSVLRHSLGQA